MKFGRVLVAVATFSTLSACSLLDSPFVKTVRHSVWHDEGVVSPRLNPDYRYLRVVIDGRVVFLALGYIDADVNGPIEVWYSPGREVLRLQNGRILGATGLFSEWRKVILPKLPPWSEVARAKAPYNWTRYRDVMPGYRYGLRDDLVLRPITAPKDSQFQGGDPGQLSWFQEDMFSRNADSNGLPPARYAVDVRNGRETVVYSEACLARDLCFSWQRWSAGVAKGGK